MNDTEVKVFTGRAFCALSENNPMRAEGMIGAYLNFACRAASLSEAVDILDVELLENGLIACGFDELYNIDYLDEVPSDMILDLINATEQYRVQFKFVHYFKSDA